MFKNNNKGFMLAEVVVTSTIVLTALVSLYATFNKLYSNYNIRKKYYNIDGLYAIKGMIDYSIETNKLNELLKDSTYGFKNNEFYFINKEDGCNSTYFNDNYCSNLKALYGIENMVIVSFDKSKLESLANDKNETFKDYIDFVKKYYNFNDTNDTNNTNKYKYLILVEYNNGDSKNLNYSSMEMW